MTNVREPRQLLDGGADLQEVAHTVDPPPTADFLAVRNSRDGRS